VIHDQCSQGISFAACNATLCLKLLIHKIFSCYKISHNMGNSSIYHFIVPQLFSIIEHRKLFYAILQQLRKKIISHNNSVLLQRLMSTTFRSSHVSIERYIKGSTTQFHHSNSWQVLRNTTELPPACTLHSAYWIPIKHLSNWK
jgi:hypothetical protein